jgi:hypothetical protein
LVGKGRGRWCNVTSLTFGVSPHTSDRIERHVSIGSDETHPF